MGNWTSPCIIHDQLLSYECNLSLLHKNEKVYYVSLLIPDNFSF